MRSCSEWAVVLLCIVMVLLVSWQGHVDGRRNRRRKGEAVERWRGRSVGWGRRERVGVWEGGRQGVGVREPRHGGRQRCRRGLVVGGQVGDPRGGRGTGQGGGRVVIRWQEPHEVKAAGVEAGGAPGSHHQDLLGVVVEGGDAGWHADSEGEPGNTDGDTEGTGRVGNICVEGVYSCVTWSTAQRVRSHFGPRKNATSRNSGKVRFTSVFLKFFSQNKQLKQVSKHNAITSRTHTNTHTHYSKNNSKTLQNSSSVGQ